MKESWHGVFYEDEHLKVEHDWSEEYRFELQAGERKEKGLDLPTTVFGTKGQEEEVGLLHKAAPTVLILTWTQLLWQRLMKTLTLMISTSALRMNFSLRRVGVETPDDDWEDGRDVGQ